MTRNRIPPDQRDDLAALAKRLDRLERTGLAGQSTTGVYSLGLGQGTVLMGTNAPPNSLGNDGDYYLRRDTPAVANQRIYVRAGGIWTGIL